MTRLFQHRVARADVPVNAVLTVAARSGVLLETPTTVRAGFGDVIASSTSTDLVALATHLFDDFTVAPNPAAPSGTGSWALTQSPFERDAPSHATVWETSVVLDETVAWVTSVHASPERALADLAATTAAGGAPYTVGDVSFHPTSEEYGEIVSSAVAAIRRGEADKIVLGRRASGVLETEIDPALVLHRWRERERLCALYAAPFGGGRFVGATPELLLSVLDDSVTAHPLAGTIALDVARVDRDDGSTLLTSSKDQFEHRVVVEEIVAALSPFCDDVRADSSPSMVTLNSIAHLGTWIHAKTDPTRRTSGLAMLAALHPTPAVGGRPRRVAATAIAQLEREPRGFFAGAVGWVDRTGNGEWWISIRGVQLTGRTFTAWAGAGVVADSDPLAEREETRNKLNAILVGLGDVR